MFPWRIILYLICTFYIFIFWISNCLWLLLYDVGGFISVRVVELKCIENSSIEILDYQFDEINLLICKKYKFEKKNS